MSFTFFLKAQSPGGVSGSTFWVRADAGVTGTTNVNPWADQSGTINNLTQSVGANQPSLVNSDINFNPSINFSASSTVMSPATPGANLNSTVFAVAKPTVNTTWRTMFRGTATDHPMIVEAGSNRLGYYDNDNGAFQNSGFTWTQNEAAVMTMEMRSGDVNFRKNGTQGSSIATINLAGINMDYFGNYQSGGQQFGKIAEVIIFNTSSALTTTEKRKVESYLAVKYGITLTHDYITADAATTTWNITTNATYSNNITGIGRDDLTGLDQRKSLSINSTGCVTLDKGGAFGTDKDFVLWGDDAAVGTSANVPSSYVMRSNRIWKTAVTGTPGNVGFSVDLSILGLPNTGIASDYALMIDANTDFSSGSTIHTTGASLVGSTLSFTGVTLSNNNYFTIAAMNIVIPGGVVGLNVWLKANSGPLKAGALPAANGDALVTWQDKSGFGHDYVGVAGPTLVTNAINFNPSVEILSGGFDAPAGSELGTDWTTFFVSKKLASDDVGRVFEGNTGNNLWAHWGNYTNSIYLEAVPSNHNSGIATTTGIQALHIHTYKRESTGGTLEARADGTSLTTYTSSTNPTGVRIDIDAGNYVATESSDARVAEMIVYNAALTATEIKKIESYLAIKYGMTITHDYLASDATVLWNATTNSTYHNNVTGIGRDDFTALAQPKSLSINATGTVTMDKGGAFGTDKDFILWGDDAAVGTSTNVPVTYVLRSKRIWKTAVTGTPGVISFSIDISALGIPNTGSAADYALLIDANTDFSSGATAHTTGASLSGNILSFTGVGFSNNDYFSIAAMNVVIPGGVVGLAVWLKANSGPLKAGALPAANGDALVTWQDKSGNNFDYTSVAGPTLVTNALNFNPAVEILSGGFDAPAGAVLGTEWTTFFVSKKLASDDVGRLFDGNTGNNLWAHWGNYTNSIFLEGVPSNYNSGIATTTGIQNLHLHAYVREAAGGTLEARADGTSLTTFGTSTNPTGVRIDIDAGNYAGTESSDARVGEMIIYNSALTAADVQKIESYLALKYGMTIAHNYLATDGTVTWNSTTNSTYHNNVTGIGRDDNTGLDQRKSLSINATGSVTLDKGGAFGSDKNFIVWGDDAATATSTNIPAAYTLRTKRIWKTAVTGTPGVVSFSVDLSVLGFANTGSVSDYALLIDANTDFSSGSTVHTTGAGLSGNILSFTNVSFSNNDYFTIAAANVIIAGSVTGCIFWAEGTTGVTGTTNVSNWADQSYNNNHATQGIAANQPSLVDPDINFNPDVNFNGNTTIMSITTPPASLNTTVFTVAAPKVNTSWRTMFRSTVSDHHLIVETGATRLGYYDTDNGGFIPSGFTWLQNEVSLVGLEMRAGDVNFRKNGTQGSSIASINLASQTMDYYGNYQGNGQAFGKIAETMIFNTAAALTSLEKNKIETYLGLKYGITLSHDYIATDGTTTWDRTANTGYNTNLTGIGRDNSTGLHQKQSKSSSSSIDYITLALGSVAATNAANGNTFAVDKSFLIAGNNNAVMDYYGVSDLPATIQSRVARVWKVQETGTVGSIRVQLDLSTIVGAGGVVGANDLQYVRLLVDADGVFAAGATILAPTSYDNTTDLAQFDFDFSTGTFFTFGSTNSAAAPLPIELISFTALPVDNKMVQLNWKTASETNNKYFEVQRSTDLLSFESISRKEGAGTIASISEYESVDHSPISGTSYYRLMQTDYDGKTSHSGVVPVTINTFANITLYPNPARDGFALEGNNINTVKIEVTNFIGEKINVKNTVTSNRITFETANLSRGVYFVIIEHKGQTERRKIILE